jgi:two-component system, OmpR family, response regulator MprA
MPDPATTPRPATAVTTILLADDDPRLIDMLRRTLAYEGYRIITASNGAEAITHARDHKPDLIVLDWMMPAMDGVTVMQRVRMADQTPILMLTGRDAVEDKVQALHSGADDYLAKPFAPEELIARVRALLRRADPTKHERPMSFNDLSLDPKSHEVRRGIGPDGGKARTVALTPREYDLLKYFMQRPNIVLQREQILQDVWGYDFGGDDSVLEVYVGYLRTKLEEHGEPRIIQTVRRVGYVLRETQPEFA